MEPVDSALRVPQLGESPAHTLGVNVGVDIGQKLDPTAIVVVELQRRGYTATRAGFPIDGETHFVVRAIERLPLGTNYRVVIGRLCAINAQLAARRLAPCFWLDATGVGKPVVDLVRAAALDVREVYITASDQAVRGERYELRLGKPLLVSRLQVLLQTERVHLPSTGEAAALIQELQNYEIRINDNANAQFGAFGSGEHDDLATALGLATWDDV